MAAKYSEEELQEILQRTLEKINDQKQSTDSVRNKFNSPLYKIPEFKMDLDAGVNFKNWFERYQSQIEDDSGPLETKAERAQFVASKLAQREYTHFAKRILPKKIAELTYDALIEELCLYFDSPTTIFRRRLKYFETQMNSGGLRELRTTIKSQQVIGELDYCTTDELNCFVAIVAMKSAEMKYARLRAISYLETKQDASFDDLMDDLERYEQIRLDSVDTAVKQKPVYRVEGAARPTSQKKVPYACYRCGGKNHKVHECRFKNETCKICKKIGHLAKVCRQAKNSNRQGNPQSNERRCSHVSTSAKIRKIELIKTTVVINDHPIEMAIDTGSEVSLIDKNTWEQLGRPQLTPSSVRLTVANGSILPSHGVMECKVDLKNNKFNGICHVTDNCMLLGLDWIKMDNDGQILNPELLKEVKMVKERDPRLRDAVRTTELLKKKFPEVTSEGLGCCKNYKARIFLKKDSMPVFRKARPIAYASFKDVEKELKRLESMQVIERVPTSLFAAPVVIVKKTNGNIRLCADYSTGLNAVIEDDHYPLPTAEDIFSTLNGGKLFSKIDLSEAYLQIPVDAETQSLLTINTPKGLFAMKRLPFGVKTAPSMFQRLMDNVVSGLEGTTAYLDDIIVTGANKNEHEERLVQLFKRLKAFGLKVNLEKCAFMEKSIKYLGFIIDSAGRRPDPEKTKAIAGMKTPSNIAELRAFLGMINFYNNFVPDMASLRDPLNNLLKKENPYIWTTECEKAFQKTKEILQSDLLLTHFDPSLPITVSADASGYGLGAVIMHNFPDGSVKAIQHAARSLSETEKKYAQIEKEALALVFAVRKFHKFIYGRKFVLNTDHKPLITIFKPGNGISAHSANRLQRWGLVLVNYDFEICYVGTKNFGEADALSRLIDARRTCPLEEDTIIANINKEVSINFFETANRIPTTAAKVKEATKRDPRLKAAMKYTISGQWPNMNKDNALYQLLCRKENLSITEDCLMYGTRIVIPDVMQEEVLKILHAGHPGMTKMKNLARRYVYWPEMDKHIETTVRQCDACQRAGKLPQRTTLQPWPNSNGPWKRIHVDYAGPIDNSYYLIVVDAFSKWPEVMETKKITSEKTIDILNELFTRHGLPEEMVSDNGTQFNSQETRNFCEQKGVKQTFTSPHSPWSNGQAERFVDTFKRSLKKMKGEGGRLQDKIRLFLRTYRNSPHRALEDKTPAELFTGRPFRSELNLLQPLCPINASINSVNAAASSEYTRKMRTNYDRHHGTKPRFFTPKETVYATKHRGNRAEWVPGTVQKQYSSVNYEVEIEGRIERKHANQMKPRYGPAEKEEEGHDESEQMALELPFYERPKKKKTPETPKRGSQRVASPKQSPGKPTTSDVSAAVESLESRIGVSNSIVKKALHEAIETMKALRMAEKDHRSPAAGLTTTSTGQSPGDAKESEEEEELDENGATTELFPPAVSHSTSAASSPGTTSPVPNQTALERETTEEDATDSDEIELPDTEQAKPSPRQKPLSPRDMADDRLPPDRRRLARAARYRRSPAEKGKPRSQINK